MSKKISQLTTLANADAETVDSFPIVDASTGETKRMLLEELDKRYPVSAQFIQSGTSIGPIAISAGTAIAVAGQFEEVQYVQGNGGPVDMSANPQVAAGTTRGQKLELIGTSDVNTVKLDNGDGLALNGSCTLGEGAVIGLRWDPDSSVWRERYRNDVV